MEVKTCKQCGEIKPISQFRRYYGGRKGTYKMCKDCERINSREKYLVAKGESMNWEEEAELDKIHKLYEYQRQMGLQPPTRQERRSTLGDSLDALLDKYGCMVAQAKEMSAPADTPAELAKWLTEPLVLEPDEYIDDVYEKLVETYRPCTGIDKQTMMPIYDDTYKPVLDAILARFTDYEDTYYSN